jgi:glycosyltransferase involved in cell wall biosynthesis
MATITAHCIVKNEENFVRYAIKSVVDFVDKIIVFNTGSTDKTVEIVQGLVKEYPDKIIFEEKGECDKKRHTELRQEMVDRTTTDWFMILDGDEVWTKRGMGEALKIINADKSVECLIAPFYLCVGDVYHKYYKDGNFEILSRKDFFFPRFIKRIRGVHWFGSYNADSLYDNDGKVFFQEKNSIFLRNRYWHLTHLKRSSKDDEEYSSYGMRKDKRRETYFILGRKINESVPEAIINENKLSFVRSINNFFVWITRKLTKNFGKK